MRRFPAFYHHRALGLYVSEPRSEKETDRPFAEPGVFVINADGLLQAVDISNVPFARPHLAGLAKACLPEGDCRCAG